MTTDTSFSAKLRNTRAQQHLADDDGGKADDDGSPSHVHVNCALILGKQAARHGDQTVCQHQAKHVMPDLVSMPCARAMFWFAPVARRELP